MNEDSYCKEKHFFTRNNLHVQELINTSDHNSMFRTEAIMYFFRLNNFLFHKKNTCMLCILCYAYITHICFV